jgi:uncharacterized BrkB/YihY/UPF0761 family membrane protein
LSSLKNIFSFATIIYLIHSSAVPVDKAQEEVKNLIPQMQMHVFQQVYTLIEGQLRAIERQQQGVGALGF